MEINMVKFGVFADLHVDIMHDCEERLNIFLEKCREENVDFIIQLGDFCYPDEMRKCVCLPHHRPINIENSLKVPTYTNKDAINKAYKNFEKPSYHVLGNHDCDMCTKEQILEYYGVNYAPYYSFDCNGFHFVVLDGNYMRIDGEDISFANGNYFDASYRPDKVTNPYISKEQLKWLKEDLAKAKGPSVLFSHQGLSSGAGSVLNYEEVKEILLNAPNRVVMSLNGHEHVDKVVKEDGIWFYNVNSMSNYWVGLSNACPNRYTKEIDEKYPNIKYTVPYTTPVFAIVTLDESGATIKGVKAEFAGSTPEELRIFDDPVSGAVFRRYREYITPEIKDRYLSFKTENNKGMENFVN